LPEKKPSHIDLILSKYFKPSEDNSGFLSLEQRIKARIANGDISMKPIEFSTQIENDKNE
jgi:hypothetical protein